MDRDTTIAFAVTIIALTLIGGIYLAPTEADKLREQEQAHAMDNAGEASANRRLTSQFSKDDIRYKFQQDEIKAVKHHRPPPTYDAVPDEPSKAEEPPLD